ncbi:methionine biosynthesis protein MetW [Mesorhizobium sp. RP14(2022)]|jgi:methionine biosynthesis protein MetW|uniref:Methionine biosynthesis protein MetW n=1 Tax=Mesorhizobium liriopis TaxID=2953882 RepID=A0ABT1CA03_9HYPH|nr:methionine biosynthesis protein MetW [Mesorhizobium liriopis]MCO6051663.1 methionine biosynthesis protein MetW [Mesorhizobium liriopis]
MSVNSTPRIDLDVIADFVPEKARVLDVGCGDGELLELLEAKREVDGRGIELSQRGVNLCVARGLSVIQGDADIDLVFYGDKSFDFVILSQTLQAMRAPRDVLEHLLRIGDRVVVSIPNFGHWKVRFSLLFRGRMPVTRHLPYSWYDTPNIHFCTIRDLKNLCDEVGARIERATALDASGSRIGLSMPWWFWNFFGQQAVFVLRR